MRNTSRQSWQLRRTTSTGTTEKASNIFKCAPRLPKSLTLQPRCRCSCCFWTCSGVTLCSLKDVPCLCHPQGLLSRSSCCCVCGVERQSVVEGGELFVRSAQSLGLLGAELDSAAVAQFLRYCPGLSKQTIGELLGENEDFFLEVLDDFTQTFDFKGKARFPYPDSFSTDFQLPIHRRPSVFTCQSRWSLSSVFGSLSCWRVAISQSLALCRPDGCKL